MKIIYLIKNNDYIGDNILGTLFYQSFPCRKDDKIGKSHKKRWGTACV